jgi:2-polyprenyl-3-methyl-5-hydroxy-6-metoxy-1,4-benzoquinol methylase
VDSFEPEQNLKAWSLDTYDAWVNRFGTPAEAAARIKMNPASIMYPLLEYLEPVLKRRIVNIMGSNGVKALALACMGADVTVIDWSASNARYAQEMAAEAEIPLRYIVSDVTKAYKQIEGSRFDIAFAELGIVHYFTDLAPFMDAAVNLLRVGGRFILTGC